MATRPKRCRRCEQGPDAVGRISRAGLCAGCAAENMIANAEQIRDRAGPFYEAWLAGQAEAAMTMLRRARGLDATSAGER